MDPKKLEAVAEWPPQENVSEVRSFLGFCRYYHRFIDGFSKIAVPLTKLTKKRRTFLWGTEEQHAFEALRESMLRAPILA